MSELYEKATPRPWYAHNRGDRWIVRSFHPAMLAEMRLSEDNAFPETSQQNAELIAHAVNSIESLEAQVAALREALEKAQATIAECGSTFIFYADSHRRKGTEDGDKKAERNDEMVNKCLEALSVTRAALSNNEGRVG